MIGHTMVLYTGHTMSGQCQEHAEDAEALLGCIWLRHGSLHAHLHFPRRGGVERSHHS